ncbi:MAG: type II toxin-antitoxin system VapC family toxin [Opitutaceae bacterium]|jgi:predicted nucleic acid-binding protein
MQTVISDTSFLFSLFGNDAHTLTARNWVGRERLPIAVSVFNRYEFQNAIRFAAFRKAISGAEATATLDAFEADLMSGHLQLISVELSAVFIEASILSERHTMSGGHRSFDILHVAVARTLKASTFLTFDENQRKLAESVRLEVGP